MNTGAFWGATILQKNWIVSAVGKGRREHSSGCLTDEQASNSQQHLSIWCILDWENGSLLLLFGMPGLSNFPWIEFYRSDMAWQAIVQDCLQWLQFDVYIGTQVDNFSTWTTCKSRHGPGHKNVARNFRRLMYITQTHMNTQVSADSRTQRELKVLKSSRNHYKCVSRLNTFCTFKTFYAATQVIDWSAVPSTGQHKSFVVLWRHTSWGILQLEHRIVETEQKIPTSRSLLAIFKWLQRHTIFNCSVSSYEKRQAYRRQITQGFPSKNT